MSPQAGAVADYRGSALVTLPRLDWQRRGQFPSLAGRDAVAQVGHGWGSPLS